MDQIHYNEMVASLKKLEENGELCGKRIYLFGHCNATEELIDLLSSYGYRPVAILDNNKEKYTNTCKGIPVIRPQDILNDKQENTIVCIVARAYASMAAQLKKFGYDGPIRKLVNYNSFADYSLSDETIERMINRVKYGMLVKQTLEQKYAETFKIICPFAALGDIFFTMSYLQHYLEKRKIKKVILCVVGRACSEVVALFGAYNIVVYRQEEMDGLIQACLYTKDKNCFIAHQDRPYTINLHSALYIKNISLEKIYCCGVFGLPASIKPIKPKQWCKYMDLGQIPKGKAVIFSPYAKSVTVLPVEWWNDIVLSYQEKGYHCLTNVTGDEKPLPGTKGISPRIVELKSVVEWAGIFVGIRSGLCDVIRYAQCDKIIFYPDYNYCDTKWKAIDMYLIEGCKNIIVNEEFKWNGN